MQEVQNCVFIMNLKLALFLKDKYIQQTQKNSKGCPQNNIRDGKNAICERHSINAWIPALPFMF